MIAQKEAGSSCCSAASKSCCSAKESCCDQANEATPKELPGGVLVIQVLKCQGLGMHWVFAPLSLPPEEAWERLELLPFEAVLIEASTYSSYVTQPTTPPPRIC